MRSSGRSSLIAAAVVLGLLIVLGAAAALPAAPFRSAFTLLAESFHLLAALVSGSVLLKIARSAPRSLLPLVVFGTALGLGLLSLLTLIVAGLGLTHAVTPWIVDCVALLIGAGRVRDLLSAFRDAWQRLDLSFVLASRIPLLAALTVVGLVHLAPPFLPGGPGDGASQHALSAQAAVRGDLRAAMAARPEAEATPVEGLLLHGRLSGGEVGARLHVALLAALLTGGAFLHAERLLGGRTAAWVGLCLASSPALLLLDVGDPASTWIALHGFLCFAELSDWCARPAPGRVALACLHGGLCLAQSAAGLATFAAVLAFLILVETLIERQAPQRLLVGLLGLVSIALVAATPALLVDSWLQRSTPWELGRARYGGEATPAHETKATRVAPDPREAMSARSSEPGWTAAGAGLRDAQAAADLPLKRMASLGPLILCLLLLVPLAPEAPEGLRHAVLMLLLGVLVWVLPAPWGNGALVLPLAALCAGTSARAMLALGGAPGRATALLLALAVPVTLLGSFNAGPDLFTGASVMTGRTSRGEALVRFVPDHALVAAVGLHATERRDLVLLLGELTDSQYGAPALRWPVASALRDPEELHQAFRSAGLSHAAVDHFAAATPPREAFATLERLDRQPAAGRYALYRVPHAPRSSSDETGDLGPHELESEGP